MHRIALPTAVIFHVVLVGALVVSATWRIDKLRAEEQPLSLAAFRAAPAGPPEGETRPASANKSSRQDARGRRQVDAATPGVAVPSGVGDGDHDGHGGGGGFGLRCPPGEECASVLDGPIAVPARRAAVETVGARLLEGQRIAGDPQIPAPARVRAEMTRAGRSRAEARIKMCLDRRGNVESLSVLGSTGYSEYDDLLMSRMRTWRYRPYRLDGAAVPVCTVVRFIYQIE